MDSTVDHHGYRLTKITPKCEANTTAFSADELAVLDSIARELGGQSAEELSRRSHGEPSWHYAVQLGGLDPALMFYGEKEDPEGL